MDWEHHLPNHDYPLNGPANDALRIARVIVERLEHIVELLTSTSK